MTIPYTYKVLHTDVPAKCMVVEYIASGYPTLQLGMPLPIAGQNAEDIIKRYAPIPQWVETTLVYEDVPTGTEGTVPPVTTTLEMAKTAKLAELADWRYRMETGGVSVGGVMVRTDRESQSQLAGAFTSLKEGFITEVQWKQADGTFTTLTLPSIEAIASAVAAHVQMSFASEKTYAEQINACTTVEAVQAITLP
jgi:hypothetical protein